MNQQTRKQYDALGAIIFAVGLLLAFIQSRIKQYTEFSFADAPIGMTGIVLMVIGLIIFTVCFVKKVRA